MSQSEEDRDRMKEDWERKLEKMSNEQLNALLSSGLEQILAGLRERSLLMALAELREIQSAVFDLPEPLSSAELIAAAAFAHELIDPNQLLLAVHAETTDADAITDEDHERTDTIIKALRQLYPWRQLGDR